MQDRICQTDEPLLQRTAGPYIRVMSDALCQRRSPDDVRYASDSDGIVAPPRSAALGHMQSSWSRSLTPQPRSLRVAPWLGQRDQLSMSAAVPVPPC
jgi:hypothetical protein